MTELLWLLMIAVAIGHITGLPARGSIPGGVLGTSMAAFAGAWLGKLFLGSFGPHLDGFFFLPSVIGSVGFVILICLLSRATSRPIG
ncbi:MAG: GlsB/YeaQ/YmgE family stress response membrane protein [Gorillibacterium sp.]|nr:GlsB/YeaQ/YmgE family stress response membrane protein [Gorillibacterium sp.]